MTQRIKVKMREAITLATGVCIAVVIILHVLHAGVENLFNTLTELLK